MKIVRMQFHEVNSAKGGTVIGVMASLFLAALLLCAAPAMAQENGASPEGAAEAEYAKDASTEINVKNADIAAVVRIFSKKTKRNYILDENVKGKVTIYLPGKVSSEEAIRILDSVLALKGFTSVPIGENLWKIIPAKDAKSSTIPTVTDDKEHARSAAVVTRLISLKYVSSEDMQQLIQPLVSPEGLINAYTGTNSLIIIDSDDNIERIAGIVSALDVPSSDRDMTIIPIKHADAVDVADKLTELLGSGDSDKSGAATGLDLLTRNTLNAAAGGAPGIQRPPGAGAASSVSTKTVSARGREPKIIPDERTNAIIVVADEDTTTRIKALISQLDSEVDLSGNRFYVYRCQHASAEELASVLGGLVDGGSGSTGTDATGFTRASARGGADNEFGGIGGAGGANLRNSRSSQRGRSGTQSGTSNVRSRPAGGSANNRQRSVTVGSGGGSLGENISITADPATNSLIISAGKTDYEKIRELLRQLDIKRRQVLVEAMLLEVGVDDAQQLSTEFSTSGGGNDGGILAKSDFGNLSALLSDPTKLSNFSVAAASSGTLTLPNNIKIPTQTVLLNAAATNNNANVLSAPNILTTDNEEAEIVVGQTVPFVASRATSDTNLNNTFNQIDREDVGITLRITPQISSGDFVTLNIFTEVSNVIAATLASELGPTTTKRQSQTTVIAKDGQMIVTGGLMSDDVSESESGVPFLKDVPVFGSLFRSTSEARRRTNLLIFITPRVVKDQFDARDNTLVKREHLEDVIAREAVHPDREEILHNSDIDHVAEGGLYEGPKPGTIRAADGKGKRQPLKTSTTLESDPAAVIELRAAPALPGSDIREGTSDVSIGEFKGMPKRTSFSSPTDNDDTTALDTGSVSAELQHAKSQTNVDPKTSSITKGAKASPAKPKDIDAQLRAQSNLAADQGTGSAKLTLGASQKQPAASAKKHPPLADVKLGEARASLKSQSLTPPTDSETRIVVMRIIKGKALSGLPFQVGEKSRAFGIVVPSGSNAVARGFFQPGESYRYQLEGSQITFEPLAIFNTLEEARAYYPDLDQKWYTLSPYEIMNIGIDPWVKGSRTKGR